MGLVDTMRWCEHTYAHTFTAPAKKCISGFSESGKFARPNFKRHGNILAGGQNGKYMSESRAATSILIFA